MATKFSKRRATTRIRSRSSGGVSRIQRDGYGPNWFDTVKKVRERDTVAGQLLCLLCGKPIAKGEPVETHHLRKVTRGGTSQVKNLGSVHKKCHDKRHPHLHKQNRFK